MNKENGLRLNNLVKWNDSVQKITAIAFGNCLLDKHPSGDYPVKLIEIEPIPLTEKWILNLGFKNDKSLFKGERIFVKGRFFLTESRMFFLIVGWDSMEFLNYSGCEINDGDNKIDSVHKLQNLYFALTGEELVFSTEP